MKPITVLLTDDNKVLRKGYRAILENEVDIRVVGEAANGRQAVELTRKLRPDVVLMDIAMPVLNGLEATREIHGMAPKTKVLVLSAHDDDAYVEQAIAFGAVGFLVKQASAHHLPAAIRNTQKGNPSFSPSIAKKFPLAQSAIGAKTTRKNGKKLS